MRCWLNEGKPAILRSPPHEPLADQAQRALEGRPPGPGRHVRSRPGNRDVSDPYRAAIDAPPPRRHQTEPSGAPAGRRSGHDPNLERETVGQVGLEDRKSTRL